MINFSLSLSLSLSLSVCLSAGARRYRCACRGDGGGGDTGTQIVAHGRPPARSDEVVTRRLMTQPTLHAANVNVSPAFDQRTRHRQTTRPFPQVNSALHPSRVA